MSDGAVLPFTDFKKALGEQAAEYSEEELQIIWNVVTTLASFAYKLWIEGGKTTMPLPRQLRPDPARTDPVQGTLWKDTLS